MTEPTAPSIPADAPPEVKAFFDCTGKTLVWRSGEVTWLGLKVTPSVEFTQDATTGALTIRVSILGGMVGFDLPASVNAAGELVVDTSSVPDLSEWGIGGRADIDAAIKRINDWFRKNGWKLKPPTFANGAVTLEKAAIAPPPAPGTVVTTPTPAPAPTPPTAPKPVAPPPASGGGCGLLGILLLAMLLGVIALGGGIGFVFFGGPGPVAQVTPTPSPSRPAPTPTPSVTLTPSITATPSVTPTQSATPVPSLTDPPTATPTSGLQAYISGVCARVKHSGFGNFVSYIDWLMYWDGYDVDYFVLTIAGTNNGDPVTLVFDPATGGWTARLGLHSAGNKPITSLIAVLDDGTPIDITDALYELLGMTMLPVRYPQADNFGTCPAE